jgi:hypothetical protein
MCITRLAVASMRTYVAAAWISSRTNGGGVITGKVAMQAVAAARRIGQGREGEREREGQRGMMKGAMTRSVQMRGR